MAQPPLLPRRGFHFSSFTSPLSFLIPLPSFPDCHFLFFISHISHFPQHFRSTSTISWCIRPLDTSNCFPYIENGWPEKSVTQPPASSTMTKPAAVSHGRRSISQNPSTRPKAV